MGERIPQLLSIPQALIKRFIDSGVIILQLKTESDVPLMLDDELKTKITGYNFMSNLVTSYIDIRFLAKAFINTILCNSVKFDMLFSSSYKGYPLLNTMCESSDMVCSLYAGNVKSRLLGTDAIAGDTVKGNVLIVESDIDSLEKSIKYIKDKGGLPIAAIVSYAQGSLQQLQSKYNIPIFAVATTDDLLKYLDYVNKKEKVSTEKPVLSIGERVEKIKDLKEKFMQYCLDKDIIIFTDEGYLTVKDILNKKDSFISDTVNQITELMGLECNRIYGSFCRFDTLFMKSGKVLIIDDDVEDMKKSIEVVRKSGATPIAALVLFSDIEDAESLYSLTSINSYCILHKTDILRRKEVEESKCIKASIKNNGYSSTLNLHDIWLKEGNNPLIDNEPLTHKLHEKFHKIKEEFYELLDTSNNTEVFTNRIMGPFKCLVMAHTKPFIADLDFNLAYPTPLLDFKTRSEVSGVTISFNEDNSQPIHKTLEGLSSDTVSVDINSSKFGMKVTCNVHDYFLQQKDRTDIKENSTEDDLYFETRYGDKLHVIDVLRNRVDEINNKINKLWKKSEYNPTEKNNLKTIKLTNELDCILFQINRLTKK